MLGKRVKEARLAKGITQAKLADGKFSRSYIGAIERGRGRRGRAYHARDRALQSDEKPDPPCSSRCPLSNFLSPRFEQVDHPKHYDKI